MACDVSLRVMMMSGPDDGLEITLDHSDYPEKLEDGVDCRFTIGRRDSSDVCIPFDTLVSRLHATLQVRGNELLLVDEGSRNGTFIGRQRIKEPVKIEVGQLFRIGQTWLRIQTLDRKGEV